MPMLYYIWLSLHTYGMFMYIYMIITTYIWNVYVYLYQYIYICIWLCTERLTGFSPRIQMLGRRLDAPVCQSQKIVFIYIYIYFYIRIVLYVWYVYNKCVCVGYLWYLHYIPVVVGFHHESPACGNSVFRSLWFTRCMVCIQLDGEKS